MKKVLIIADSLYMRMYLKKAMESCMFESIGEAGNGANAIKLYFELKPDIIVLDTKIPDLYRLELLKIIKSLDYTTQIIMVSDIGNKTCINKALKTGAVAYIVVPSVEKHQNHVAQGNLE